MKKQSGIWDYLKSIPNLLEKGDAGEIASAKQEYWRMKNRGYQIARREKNKEVKICITPKEWETLSEGAKRHNTSVSNFTKQVSLAYLNQVFVTPDILTVKKIEASFLRSLTAIERIASKEKKGWLARSNDYEELKDIVYDMRTSLKKELYNPELLLSVIVKHPETWEEIKKVIR